MEISGKSNESWGLAGNAEAGECAIRDGVAQRVQEAGGAILCPESGAEDAAVQTLRAVWGCAKST